jgi:transcription elongation factor Elf1
MTKFVQQKYITSIGLSSLSTRGDKYNFRCPFCGDSKKNQRKKRGWLLWNEPFDTYIFSCHNCGINTNFDKMLEENFIDEYNLYEVKLELLDWKNTKVSTNHKYLS